MRMKKICYVLCVSVICLMLCLSSGCSLFGKKEKKWKPVKPRKQAFVHTVTWEKETFEIIAEWYTGSKDNTDALINANPAVNEEILHPGDLVFIPGRMLKTRKNLTESFVMNYYKKPKPKPKISTSTTKRKSDPKPSESEEKKAEEFELFGPR